MATTIDALGLAEDFEKVGFSRDQALGKARAIRDHASETLATKADLRELELRLKASLAQLETRLEQKIADVQIGLIKWFTGIMIAQGAAIVALIKLLPGPS
jgi:hypothetical protein